MACFLFVGLIVSFFIIRVEVTNWQNMQAQLSEDVASRIDQALLRSQAFLTWIQQYGADHIFDSQDHLKNFLMQDPALREVVYLDKDGNELAHAFKTAPVLTQPLEKSSGVLSGSFIEDKNTTFLLADTQELSFVRAEQDADGSTIAIRMQINLAPFLERKDQKQQNGRIYLVDESGGVIAQLPLEPSPSRLSFAQIPEFHEIINSKNRRWQGGYLALMGEPVVAVSLPVPNTGWFVIAEIPRTEAYSKSRMLFVSMFVAILIGILLILFVQDRVLNRMLLRPLALLADGARGFGRGEFEKRISIDQQDEMGNLADVMNRMAVQIDEREKELKASRDALIKEVEERREIEEELRQSKVALQAANDTLEQRVRERTEEWSAVNQKLEVKLNEYQQAESRLKIQSETLTKKTYQQEKLIETARQLAVNWDIHDVLRRIAQGAKDIFNGFGCVIYLLEGRVLSPVVAIDPVYESQVLRTQLDVDSSLNGEAVRARRGMIFNSPLETDNSYQIPETSVDDTERLIVAPLMVNDEVFGSMCINRMENDFTEEDLALAETFAAYASSVLQIAQSHEKLQREVEDRRRAEESLRESEERYMLATQGANDGIWDWDLRSNRIYLSTRWKSMLGYSEEEIGTNLDEWFGRVHPDDLEAMGATLTRHLHGSTPHFESEYRMRHKDGTYRWVQTRGLAVRAPADYLGETDVAPYRMAGSQSDITARKRAEEQLIHDAFHDMLTHLPNRALFLDRLGHAIERFSGRRSEGTYAVLFLDLDRFKVINDSLGHTIGDHLLISFANRLISCLRASDTAARLGGDEFAVLLEDIKEVADASRTTERIIDLLKQPFHLETHEIVATASVGIVFGASLGETLLYENPEDVLRDADIAMYHAKSRGKNCFVVFDPSLRTRAVNRLELENELRAGLERGELMLNYQPICSLQDGRITGFEALLRWRSPTRGLVPPIEFIPVAEETGLIVPIGEWVLREACRQICDWQKKFPQDPPLTISVNISVIQFAHPSLLEQVQAILQETGLDPNCLRLEITESVFMEAAEQANAILLKLRDMGVNLQIDDFGTGYSSLSYIQHFPINSIKIDQSFVRYIDSKSGEPNNNGTEIIRTIVALACDLGMEAVAEGVETPEQLSQLQALHCHYGQGFYLGLPLAPDAAEANLVENFGLSKPFALQPGTPHPSD